MRRNRRVKIVATLGPASSAPEVLERLFLAGADVFRINMSHSSHETARVAGALRARCRRQASASDRHPVRSAGAEVSARRIPRRARVRQRRRNLPLRSHRRARDRRSASACRIRRSSRPPRPAIRCCIDDGKVRMRVIERKNGVDCGRGGHGRRALQPQGREPARYRAADRPVHGQGSRRPRLGLGRSARIGSRCRSCSAPTTSSRPRG